MTRLIWRRWRGREPTGIDRVALAYLRHFGARSQAVIQHERLRAILTYGASKKLFALLDKPPKHFRASLLFGGLTNARQRDGRGRGRLYLNVGHTGLDSSGFRRWVATANVRPVYLVHDLIPVTHPQFCRSGEDARHRKRLETVLKTAAGVIGNSQATVDELVRFARAERLGMPAALAAWLGSEPLPNLGAGQPLPERPTFVTLGTIEARKNHMLLLEIWSRLIDRFGPEAPRLLVIGSRGWEAQPVFDLLDKSEKLRGHVVEMSGCSDTQLASHFASARALLFPSFVEGYGLPLLEALACGVPVIASDLPVFREIAGNVPTYLAPTDERGWETAIIDYAFGESAARKAQFRRMRGFSPATWESHFEKVESWLESLG